MKDGNGCVTVNTKNDMLWRLLRSWRDTQGKACNTTEILRWVEERNRNLRVEIRRIALADSKDWFYDVVSGQIVNQNRSFFQIGGLQELKGGEVFWEQPVLLQNEIGYLGMICKEIGGVLHFLMQGKIEPGNVNKIQLSPTVQATKSNFTQKHGGRRPAYIEYFINARPEQILVDQIQSEQSSRFYKKRNRNIIVLTDEEVPILPSHRWMTLGQIKELMRVDNLVNMDTRTVHSCIPFALMDPRADVEEMVAQFADPALGRSLLMGMGENLLPRIYRYINDCKMFSETDVRLTSLEKLATWSMRGNEFVCSNHCDFKVIFCDIAIEGREVARWTQPLFAASGTATFGLLCYDEGGVKKCVVRAREEVGCFDLMELGPTVQLEASVPESAFAPMDRLFFHLMREHPERIGYDVVLSEEGGRFYHEQNRNLILQVDAAELPTLPDGYFAVDLRTLNLLCQINNCLNIQLRNLLSLFCM